MKLRSHGARHIALLSLFALLAAVRFAYAQAPDPTIVSMKQDWKKIFTFE